jgi:ubiquinone/menaquinone biosynthesis C-methylase UbiE
VGPDGRVIGVDMTDAMLEKSRRGAVGAGLRSVEFRKGMAEELPIEDSSVDLVISNGVINLAADKKPVFAAIARILKPGGRVQVSDIVVGVELSEKVRRDIDLWTG